MASPASGTQSPAANPGGTAADKTPERESALPEGLPGSSAAQEVLDAHAGPKPLDVQGGNEGEKREKHSSASKIVSTPAPVAKDDRDRQAASLRQFNRSSKKASASGGGGLESGGTMALSLSFAADPPSEGKVSPGVASPSRAQHKAAEAMATSPVKARIGPASTTPLPYKAAYPIGQGPLQSGLSLTSTTSQQSLMTSQQGMTGGAASTVPQPPDGRPSWRKQDSTSLEDKAMDVLPEVFFDSFEEELRKEVQRLRKSPAAALPNADQALVQPLGEGGQATAAEEHQEGPSAQRPRYGATVTWSDPVPGRTGGNIALGRTGAPKSHLGQSTGERGNTGFSDNTGSSFLGSMSETDFALSTSNLDADDPLRLKHSRLTPQLFSIHSEQAQVPQVPQAPPPGMQTTGGDDDSLDQSGHRDYVSGDDAKSFRAMRHPHQVPQVQPQQPQQQQQPQQPQEPQQPTQPPQPQQPGPPEHEQQAVPRSAPSSLVEAAAPNPAGPSPRISLLPTEGLHVEVHVAPAPTSPVQGLQPLQISTGPLVSSPHPPSTPTNSARREGLHLTTVRENDDDDDEDETGPNLNRGSEPHAGRGRHLRRPSSADTSMFSPRAEWPDQLPHSVPALEHLRHGDTTGSTGTGKAGTWPFDRSDARDTTTSSEDPNSARKQTGGKQDVASQGELTPYRDNLDYLRDQFRLMRIIEERNRVNREELITHAFGTDPMEEALFSEVNREYPIPREFDGSYTGPSGNYGASSALNGTLTELLQLLGSDRVLLHTDDDEASRYLSRMWDDDVGPGSDSFGNNNNNNNTATMRDPGPISSPQRPSICKPLMLQKRQNSAGAPSTGARSLSAATLDINQTPRPVRSTQLMSEGLSPTSASLTSATKATPVPHTGSDYETVTDTESGASAVLMTGGSTGGSSTAGGSARTTSSNTEGKTAPSTSRGRSGGSVSVATDEGGQWEQPTVSTPPRAKTTGSYGGRRTQSDDGDEFPSDHPKEVKRHALTANLRQKEKVLRAHIRQKLIATWTQCRWIPRLEVLSKAFDLSRFEKLVLVNFVAKHFAKVYLGLRYSLTGSYGLRDLIESGEEETTIQDLARSFLPRLRDQMVAPFKYFSPSSPLVRESIITVFQGAGVNSNHMTPHHHRLHPMLQRVAINLSIAEHLLDTASMHPGAKHLDRHLRAHEEEGVHEPSMPLRNVILPLKTRQKIETALKNLGLYLELRRRPALGMGPTSRRGCGTIFLFTGKTGSGKSLLAEAVATELGKKLVSSGRVARPNFSDLFMQAKMNDAVIVATVQGPSFPGGYAGAGSASLLHEAEGEDSPLIGLLRSALEGSHADWSSFEEEMERHNDLVILIAQSASLLPKPLRRWVSLLVELDEQPDHILRRQLWEVMRPEDFTLAGDVDLDALAVKWAFNAGLIKSSWIMAQLFAVLRDGEAPRITMEDLHKAARNQLDEKLRMEAPDDSGPLTSRGPPGAGGLVTGLDLAVLNPSLRESLWMIVNNAKACEVVYGQWGFRPDHAAVAGVKALFWGPPGTGKTHATHCISYELGKMLKVANAAQLTSKFVGDTGKNLQKLFREAKESGSVLLFDEAEGLFAERKDSSEKHDLEEANLLLQLVESFDGVMIATTNRPELVDVAFRRRFDIWVEFSEPSDRERSELWRQLFPPQAPLAKDLDFVQLGKRFPMSGGHIKSAVRRAAMRAALRPTVDQLIKMEDLLWAATEEMKKKDGGPAASEAPSHLYS